MSKEYSIKHHKRALIIFAKEPQEGLVKTRLLNSYSSRIVTLLYKAFIKDITGLAVKVLCDERFIYYATSGNSIPFLRQYNKKFTLKKQGGKDLGTRMFKAFRDCFKKGFDRVIIIGTDCLTLTAADIQRAFIKLKNYDCVLGPAQDGGYYLIGLRGIDRKLFDNIPWSSSRVLKETLQRLSFLKKSFYLFKKKDDIDTAESLNNLAGWMSRNRAASHTKVALKKYFS